MDFSLTEERRMLRESLSGTLQRKGGSDWDALTGLGVGVALLPEDQGGFGGAGPDIALVFRELGFAGAVTPALESCILGVGILAQAGSDTELVEAAMSGEALITFAHEEPGSRYSDNIETRAEDQAGTTRLTGRKSLVFWGDKADWLVVSALHDGGPALFLLKGEAKGVQRRAYQMMDGSSGAEITLDGAEARLLGPLSLADRPCAAAILALCATAQGAMEAAFDMTLGYLKERKQFGRPLSTLAALQHRMADLRSELEQVRSAVINLAGHLDDEDREIHVSATKSLVGRIALMMAEEAIQLHGGIGMTEEYALGHFARLLIASDHRFGDSDYHLTRFIRLQEAA